MTPDERTLLSNFLQDLSQARTGPKDAEAEAMIRQSVASNPDAAYLLVQHTILSDQALQAAQQRIADLEAQMSPQQSGGFFGGGQRQSPWSSAGQTSVPPTQQPYAPPPQASPFSGGGGLGGFLRQAGTMAAGVAAGDMLFEGLSGLFGGHRGYGGFGGGFGGFGGGFGGGPTVENVTVNEYNDSDSYDPGYDSSGGGDDWSSDT